MKGVDRALDKIEVKITTQGVSREGTLEIIHGGRQYESTGNWNQRGNRCGNGDQRENRNRLGDQRGNRFNNGSSEFNRDFF